MSALPQASMDGTDDRQRFLLELEFVQCLSNPGYINCALKQSFILRQVSTQRRESPEMMVFSVMQG